MGFSWKAALGAVTAVALSAGLASAATISVNGNLPGYVNQSRTVAFDINGRWNGTDQIVGASLFASFRDDVDRRFLGSTTSGQRLVETRTRVVTESYDCGSVFRPRTCTRQITVPVRYYEQTTIRRYTDDPERATIVLGAQNMVLQTGFYSRQTQIGLSGYNFNRLRTRTIEEISGFRGPMSGGFSLDASNIADLLADGRIDVNLTVTGDFLKDRFELRVTTAPAQPTSVPAPASAGLLASALGLAAILRRRKRRG